MHEIINSLFRYADKLSSGTQSFADIQSRSIIINKNDPNYLHLSFVIAHEISHVLLCDRDDAILSFSTVLNTTYENEANVNAVKLLVPYYVDDREIEQINLDEFMHYFGIPNSFKDIANDAIKNYIK